MHDEWHERVRVSTEHYLAMQMCVQFCACTSARMHGHVFYVRKFRRAAEN